MLTRPDAAATPLCRASTHTPHLVPRINGILQLKPLLLHAGALLRARTPPPKPQQHDERVPAQHAAVAAAALPAAAAGGSTTGTIHERAGVWGGPKAHHPQRQLHHLRSI